MPTDLLQSLLSNLWSIFLIIVFFGGSIFVHELGHFLAARRRGVHVERFSIGFGPKIFSWRGRDGVEYRLSWLPLGGYVLLPQLADMRGIEGESATDVAKLPPLGYFTKMIVFVAGAVFNMLFAFLLACVIWVAGQPTSTDLTSTRIGTVETTITLPDGQVVPSPAAEAGLRPGDNIRALDGKSVGNWLDFMQTLWAGGGHTPDGRPMTVFTVERGAQVLKIPVYPRIAGDEQMRFVGISNSQDLIIHSVDANSAAARAGLQPGDRITGFGGTPLFDFKTYQDYLAAHTKEPVAMRVLRDGKTLTLTLPARPGDRDPADIGAIFKSGYEVLHPSPFKQISDNVVMTFRVLAGLLNPHSDIGISKLTGPVGIVRMFHSASEAGIRLVIWFTILINVNLAIFNLLPIPVLDGGHMAFATIGKLRGRALPADFIAATQSVFIVLLFSMMIYVSFFDVRRMVRDHRADSAAAAPATPAPAAPAN